MEGKWRESGGKVEGKRRESGGKVEGKYLDRFGQPVLILDKDKRRVLLQITHRVHLRRVHGVVHVHAADPTHLVSETQCGLVACLWAAYSWGSHIHCSRRAPPGGPTASDGTVHLSTMALLYYCYAAHRQVCPLLETAQCTTALWHYYCYAAHRQVGPLLETAPAAALVSIFVTRPARAMVGACWCDDDEVARHGGVHGQSGDR